MTLYRPQAWNKHIRNNYDIRNIIFSYAQPCIPIRYTVGWLYKIMSKTEPNSYRPQAWNRYIKNNYDIRNLIFSYVPTRQTSTDFSRINSWILKNLGGKKGCIRNFQMAHRSLSGSRLYRSSIPPPPY